MSSQMSRRPVFRLTLGYPILTIAAERAGPEGAGIGALTEIDLAGPGYAAQLRALAVAVRRARGVLRAILPEREVWRGLVAAPDAEARARRLAAALLGSEDLALIAGAPGPTGETPFAAASRATLAEARRFLRRHGLRPASFAGAGAFPGFAAAPRFPAGVTPRGPVLAALADRARAMRPALPAIADLLPGWPPSGAFVAGGGLTAACALVALVAALAPGGAGKAPSDALPATSARLADASATQAAPAAQVAVPHAAAPRLLAAATPPELRPGIEARPRPAERDTRIAMSAPAPARAPILDAGPIITMGTRNMVQLEGVRLRDDLSAERVAELVGGPLIRSDVISAAPPPPRPEPARGLAAVAASPAAILDENGAILRPAARPAERAAVASAATAFAAGAIPAGAEAGGAAYSEGPRPRPSDAAARPLSPAIVAAVAAEPVRVASLSPEIPLSTFRPEPRPERASAKPTSQPPRPIATVVTPAPASMPSIKSVAVPGVATTAPTVAQPVRQAPALLSAARQPASQPRLAAAAPAAQQRRASFGAAGANRAVETSGIARGGLSLLGVFGTQGARHALIRLPNGAVQRVRIGDTVAGAQVAAVSEDSVRLSGSGRDVVLSVE